LEICLQQLLPLPLKDALQDRPSDIWNRDCRFNQGEYIHIRAPSGTGKSTLIHYLYRLRTDYAGSITLDNQDLRNTGPARLAQLRQRHLSVVFQDLRLFGELTTAENLEVKRALTPEIPREIIPDYAGRLGITEKLGQSGNRLSYGEQQRVAIIRSLLQPFDWILLDEPFSHLDHLNIRHAASLIAEACLVNKSGMIIVDLEEDDHFDYTRKLML